MEYDPELNAYLSWKLAISEMRKRMQDLPYKRKEQIGDCTLYLGDCLEILPTLGKVDAVVTDPPYGTHELGGGYGRRQLHCREGAERKEGRTIANDKDLSCYGKAINSIPMKDGYALVFYAPRKIEEFLKETPEGAYFGEVIWNKKQMGLGYTVRYAHESIAVLKFGEAPRPNYALESVITCHQLEKLHPHQKPIGLMERFVGWQKGNVLDPFMGSGSTGVACVNLGKPFIGIEFDPVFFDLACNRIEEAHKQIKLFSTNESTQEGFDL